MADEAIKITTITEAAVPHLGLRKLAFVVLFAGVVAVFLAELMIGVVKIPLSQIIAALIGGEVARETWARIVLDLRLPRALTALFAGGALGASGLMMQTLFRNPLASPWTLGMAAGSALGVAFLVVIAGASSATAFLRFNAFGDLSLAAAAALGCVLTMAAILAVSKRVSTVTLLIVGLMTHYFIEGVVSVLLHLTDETQIRVYSGCNDGNFANVTWAQMKILAPIVSIGLVISLLLVKPLNALLLGEGYARTLGLTVGHARLWAFGATAALAGAVTAYCGPVVFLGVAIPHLARGIFNNADHRVLMPASILIGALLGLAADLVTHLDWGFHVFHLNTVNALIGAPVVMWVLLRRKNMRSLEL